MLDVRDQIAADMLLIVAGVGIGVRVGGGPLAVGLAGVALLLVWAVYVNARRTGQR